MMLVGQNCVMGKHADAIHFLDQTYHDLLGLGKVVSGVAVEDHLADRRDGDQLLWHNLGRIKQIETVLESVILAHNLHTKFPLRVVPGLDVVPKIRAMEVKVLTTNVLCFVPGERSQTLLRTEVVLDQHRLALSVDEAEGVHSETINVAERPRNTVGRHSPHESVQRRGVAGEEIPRGVVRSGGLGDFIVGLGFDGVDEIRELRGVLDEEGGDSIANDICSSSAVILSNGIPITHRSSQSQNTSSPQTHAHHALYPATPLIPQRSRNARTQASASPSS